jgi:uncharacterized protein (DUF433 family)
MLAINAMTEQEMYQYIEMTPFRGRKPIFRGTDLTVEHIIEDFAKGMTAEEILKEHKSLTEKHIQAVFVYVQALIRDFERLRVAYSISG